MTPLALAPPAIEPVSLSEAKDFLRILADDEDELLETLLTAARLMIEAGSGRLLIAQRWRIVIDAWPPSGAIRLPLSPVLALVDARVHRAGAPAEPVPLAALSLVPGSDPPAIAIADGVQSPGRARYGIEIDLFAGFGETRDTVPAPLRQAVLRLACRWFEHRGDVVSRDAARLPAEIAALIAPYRRARLL